MPAADFRTETVPRPRRKAVPAATDPALAEKALAVHARLCPVYGCPIPYFHSLDPVSELVSSLLSHRTRNAESGRAFKALRARFPDWDTVIDADVPEIEAAIAGVTWPELKAPRIRDVLRAVRDRCGSLDLAFLADMEVEAARAWLQAIPGIGPKTSAAVLSFSTLRMPALPVDSHHHRVAQRLGLIGKRVDVGPSHPILRAQLPAAWSAQDLYDNHEILMLHGQQVCHHQRPACGRCVLVDLCPSARLPVREP
ncbi:MULTISPECIES: endonuclease III domain-containing protein [Methylobacterium]|jgi:endonuclease-3|uniref:Fe-S cluster assembly protein HesB n=1 Tax=Methylobacterium longum TaxID=767694 RepID=A0ABT8AJP4_9HYPH|nr:MULTISPECIES: Fe-S cluster assembly protein HesB [Methylobacterium]MCJ2101440.1 Fe-S cluster assembly protein HesB [Methylobacterium sp. E-046]MDN3569731.1 Fe-S cluster assembly protein HesB [Methylobacterium longum]GJE11766.1 Endonuclease III [Methylobacterium longum]